MSAPADNWNAKPKLTRPARPWLILLSLAGVLILVFCYISKRPPAVVPVPVPPAVNAGSKIPVGPSTIYRPLLGVSSVKIKGTTTLHGWEMEGKTIGGTIEFASSVILDPDVGAIAGITNGKIPVQVRAFIPVKSIHSKAEHMPEVMDRLMQDALKADAFPMIRYTLTEMTVTETHDANDPLHFDTTGNLTIAGVTNKVRFPVSLGISETGMLKISGKVPLTMTDYRVTPPAPNFGSGAIKCGNDIEIIIDWTLKKRV